MSEPAKHTPGPWYLGAMNDALFIINKPPRPSNDHVNPDHDTRVIARVMINEPEDEANAQLMVASPRMYNFVVEHAGRGEAEAIAILEEINATLL